MVVAGLSSRSYSSALACGWWGGAANNWRGGIAGSCRGEELMDSNDGDATAAEETGLRP
jgi:hypothetical protein